MLWLQVHRSQAALAMLCLYKTPVEMSWKKHCLLISPRHYLYHFSLPSTPLYYSDPVCPRINISSFFNSVNLPLELIKGEPKSDMAIFRLKVTRRLWRMVVVRNRILGATKAKVRPIQLFLFQVLILCTAQKLTHFWPIFPSVWSTQSSLHLPDWHCT